jgi:large repetitive protein
MKLLRVAMLAVVSLALAAVLWTVHAGVACAATDVGRADPCSVDADGDGLSDCQEDVNGNGVWEPAIGETDPRNADSDGDGLTDGEERLHNGRVAALLAAKQLTFKALERLDPNIPDSDADCIPDGVELGVAQADAGMLVPRMPAKPHLVLSAGCRALLEKQNVTSLENAISVDGSGKVGLDNIAMLYDLDPSTLTDPTSEDSDGDGLADGLEDRNLNGRRDAACAADAVQAAATGASAVGEGAAPSSAGETACEGILLWSETDPSVRDSDGDGLLDGEEGDRDGDGKLGLSECDPLKIDTDGDGVPDGDERRFGTKSNLCDTDGDGLSDGVELGYIQPDDVNGCHGLQPAGTNDRHPHVMNPLNPDSDGDALSDGKEDANSNGWVDPGETDPSEPDTDGDGLDDGIEATGDFNHDGLADFDIGKVPAEGSCLPTLSDIDCDGVPNALDTDSDSDGCPDAAEGGTVDANGNGIPDVYDVGAKSCEQAESGGSNAGGAVAGAVNSKPSEDEPSATANAASFLQAPSLRDGQDGGACALIGEVGSIRPTASRGLLPLVFLSLAAGMILLLRRRWEKSLEN